MDNSTTPYVHDFYTHLKPTTTCQKDSQETGSVYKSRGKRGDMFDNCSGEGQIARHDNRTQEKDGLSTFSLILECTAPYDQPQALTTTNMFQANHEDAYDSDVDEGPNAAVAFMANLSSTSATNNPVNEVHYNDNQIFDNVDYQLSQDMHQEEHLDSDAKTEIDDNTIPYHPVSILT
ncbi:hypothetical protein Tco_0218348 [Tanacetum coccineum]